MQQKRFTLIPFTDNRGLTIPTTESEAYRITEGDTYKITDIHLPKSYEDDARKIYGMPDITSSSHAHRHGRNISLPLNVPIFERFAKR